MDSLPRLLRTALLGLSKYLGDWENQTGCVKEPRSEDLRDFGKICQKPVLLPTTCRGVWTSGYAVHLGKGREVRWPVFPGTACG